MNWFDKIARAVSGGTNQKYMQPYNKDELYNELNKELFRWIYRGTPHMIDDSMENYISQAYTYNSIVYSIINYMGTSAASVGWTLEERKGNKVEEIFEHEFLDLWHNPNEDQTLSEFTEAQLIYKYATGNTLIYAPRLETGPNKGKFVKLEVMPSHVCTPIYDNPMEPVKGWVINYNNYERVISKDNVLHIKYVNPDVQNVSTVMGMSPLKALLTVITQNNNAWRALAASFQNGGPAGIFSKDGSTPDADFTQTQAKELIERLKGENAGPNRKNTFNAIGGNVKYTPIGLSPVDLNILESIKISFIQICNAFKFPAPLLNFDQAMTFNVFSESQKILWSVALKQDLDIIGQKVTKSILPAYGDNLVLRPDYSKVPAMQADRAKQVEWLQSAWWIKGSRKQEIMGEEVDNDMDKYFIPAGLIPVDDVPTMDVVEDNLKRLHIDEYNLKKVQ
jgi:HK97 family phage portal protein